MITLRLRILASTPNPSDWSGVRTRGRYRVVRRRWKQLLTEEVLHVRERLGVRRLPWPRPPVGRVHVHVVRYAPRLYDEDAFQRSLGPVVDGLRDLQLVAHETRASVEVTAKQEHRGRSPYAWTEIELAFDNVGEGRT